MSLNNRIFDLSLWGVVLGNALSIVLALVQGWDMGEIMWVYWGQSIIIGLANALRIFNLKEFSTENFQMNDQPVEATPQTKREVGVFFLIHYGMFHFVYAVFLWQELPLNTIAEQDLFLLMLCVMGFMVSHFFSLAHNFGQDFKHKKPNIGTLMFYPYLRIIPMHLTIIFGHAMDQSAMVLFMILKTLADAGMHMIEHHLFRKPRKGPLRLKD